MSQYVHSHHGARADKLVDNAMYINICVCIVLFAFFVKASLHWNNICLATCIDTYPFTRPVSSNACAHSSNFRRLHV